MRLGDVGDGWRVADHDADERAHRVRTTLAKVPRGHRRVADGGTTCTSSPAEDDPVRRDAVTRKWIENEVVRLTTLRAQELRDKGTPGPEGSVIKLAYTWASYSTYELGVDLMGAYGMLIDNYDMVRPTIMGGSSLGGSSEGPPNPQKAWLTSLGGTIGGGTSPIAKNVLGKASWGCPATCASTRSCRGQRCRAADRPTRVTTNTESRTSSRKTRAAFSRVTFASSSSSR